jgi:flagellar basal-body rod modification protein FlgD
MVTAINHQAQAAQTAQALGGPVSAKPMAATASSGSSSSSTSSSAATITSNDFLTLLVTELKNQDPTTQADPNEYVNQLCEVNSLEQLVSINQTLTGAFGGTATKSTSSGNGAAAQVTGTAPAISPQIATPSNPTAQARAAYHANALATQSSTATNVTPGNLGVPSTNPNALRVAQSLSGQTRTQ